MAQLVVIDDEKSVRDVLVKRLERKGHKVISFPDAEPALESLDPDSVDLIIIDLLMPTRGEILIETVRSRGHSVPIIVLSGVLEDGDEERLKSLGVDTVLAKPLKMMGLLVAVEQLLGGTVSF